MIRGAAEELRDHGHALQVMADTALFSRRDTAMQLKGGMGDPARATIGLDLERGDKPGSIAALVPQLDSGRVHERSG